MTGLLTTMLFVPGSDREKLGKLRTFSARAFILDLEDAIAISAKSDARTQVTKFVEENGGALNLHVRVNSVDSGLLFDDLAAVVVPGLSGIVLPKVTSASDVHTVDQYIGTVEHARGLPTGSIELTATIETVEGVLHCSEIALATMRLKRLCFGAGDFSLDIGLDWPSPDGILSPTIIHAKTELVLASRHAGLEPPHDGVFPNFRDADGLRSEAKFARAMGFVGKHAIHPEQLPIIEDVFRPSARQVERARRIVDAFERAERMGSAAVSVDEQLVDYPVVHRARQLLTLADAQDPPGLPTPAQEG